MDFSFYEHALHTTNFSTCPKVGTCNSYIVFFINSFAATAGTNTRNATFKIVHSSFITLIVISNMKMSQLRYHTDQLFNNHSSCKSYYVQNRTFKTVR